MIIWAVIRWALQKVIGSLGQSWFALLISGLAPLGLVVGWSPGKLISHVGRVVEAVVRLTQLVGLQATPLVILSRIANGRKLDHL